MKINLTNLNKLAKMHSEGCDVQEQVQHLIDTEPELILQALGSDYADPEMVESAREQLKQSDGWKILLNSIENMSRKVREKKALEKAELNERKTRVLEFENYNIVRSNRSIDVNKLRVLAREACYDYVGFVFPHDKHVPRIFPRKKLADILAACKGVTFISVIVDSQKLVIEYQANRIKGRYRLELATSNDQPAFLHLPIAA